MTRPLHRLHAETSSDEALGLIRRVDYHTGVKSILMTLPFPDLSQRRLAYALKGDDFQRAQFPPGKRAFSFKPQRIS